MAKAQVRSLEDLQKLKIAELKSICKESGLSTNGTKQDLIDILQQKNAAPVVLMASVADVHNKPITKKPSITKKTGKVAVNGTNTENIEPHNLPTKLDEKPIKAVTTKTNKRQLAVSKATVNMIEVSAKVDDELESGKKNTESVSIPAKEDKPIKAVTSKTNKRQLTVNQVTVNSNMDMPDTVSDEPEGKKMKVSKGRGVKKASVDEIAATVNAVAPVSSKTKPAVNTTFVLEKLPSDSGITKIDGQKKKSTNKTSTARKPGIVQMEVTRKSITASRAKRSVAAAISTIKESKTKEVKAKKTVSKRNRV